MTQYTEVLGIKRPNNPALFDAIATCDSDSRVLDVLKTDQFRACIPDIVLGFNISKLPPLIKKICWLLSCTDDLEKCQLITSLFRMTHVFPYTEDSKFVSIHLGLEILQINRLLLTAEIPYFRMMFCNGMREAQQNIVHLDISEFSPEIYKLVFRYLPDDDVARRSILHSFRVKDIDKVCELLVLSDVWGMDQLRDLCEEWIIDHVDFTLKMVCEWQNDLSTHNCPQLKAFFKACQEKAKEELKRDITAEGFDFQTIPEFMQHRVVDSVIAELLSENSSTDVAFECKEAVQNLAWHPPTVEPNTILQDKPVGSYLIRFKDARMPRSWRFGSTITYELCVMTKEGIQSGKINKCHYNNESRWNDENNSAPTLEHLIHYNRECMIPVRSSGKCRRDVLAEIFACKRRLLNSLDVMYAEHWKSLSKFGACEWDSSKDCNLKINLITTYLLQQGCRRDCEDKRPGHFVRFERPDDVKEWGAFLKRKHREYVENAIKPLDELLNKAAAIPHYLSARGEVAIHCSFNDIYNIVRPKQLPHFKTELLRRNYTIEELPSSGLILSKMPEQPLPESCMVSLHPWIHPTSACPAKVLAGRPEGSCLIQLTRIDDSLHVNYAIWRVINRDGDIGYIQLTCHLFKEGLEWEALGWYRAKRKPTLEKALLSTGLPLYPIPYMPHHSVLSPPRQNAS